jgi:hypothetical protein
MTIQDQKELRKLMQLCREMGVLEISVDNIIFKLDGSGPTIKQPKVVAKPSIFTEAIQEETRIMTPDALTEEQLLNWSSAPGGIPG